MSAPTRARERTLIRPLIYIFLEFLGMIDTRDFKMIEIRAENKLTTCG